jgi:hypothetical protein
MTLMSRAHLSAREKTQALRQITQTRRENIFVRIRQRLIGRAGRLGRLWPAVQDRMVRWGLGRSGQISREDLQQ